MTKVLIIDDHPLIRRGLAAIVTSHEGMNVAGEADSCEVGVALARSVSPDLVFLDLNVPDAWGVDGISAMRDAGVSAPIIIFSIHDELIDQAFAAGADAFIVKDATPGAISGAVRAVLSDQPFSSKGALTRPGTGSSIP